MGLIIFLAVLCAVLLGIGVVYHTVRRKIRGFFSRVFGTADILGALEKIDTEAENTPRSLNGCDTLLMPQILRDFPDFDVTLAKTYVRRELQESFGHNTGFNIHNVVIARYLPSGAQKTIVFQTAVSWKENAQTVQKRFDLHYTYILSSASDSVAANCPNCGGAISFGVTQCPYCDSRVANVLGNVWKFTEIKES